MKLIDLLVQELPKRGGWPEGAKGVVQDPNSKVCFTGTIAKLRLISDKAWVGGKWDGDWENEFYDHLADDWNTSIVTREQYETAVKPDWNGEGLPPVGYECEVSPDGGRTWCTYKAVSDKNGLRLVEIGDFTEDFQNTNWSFRQIRSEADRKRDAAVEAMIRHKDEVIQPGTYYHAIYDAIAAGKIPGIRIE